MKTTFILNGSLNEIWQEKLNKVEKNSLIVFGFNGLGLVSYKKELEGKTEYFQDVAKFSKQLNSVVICGCDTETYGMYRHSAVIAEKGKILGVSDCAYSVDDSEYVPGGYFRVYDTFLGKIGVLVGEDLFFFESAKILASCDADFIICLQKKVESFISEIMLRAQSFSNGVLMGLISKNYFLVSNIKGEIEAKGKEDIFTKEIKIQKDYHLIGLRKRGLFRDFPKR